MSATLPTPSGAPGVTEPERHLGLEMRRRFAGPIKADVYCIIQRLPPCPACGARHPIASRSSAWQSLLADLRRYRDWHYMGLLERYEHTDIHGVRIAWDEVKAQQLAAMEAFASLCQACGARVPDPDAAVTEPSVMTGGWRLWLGHRLLKLGAWLHHLFDRKD